MKKISLLLLTILSIEVLAQKSTYTDRKYLSDGETIKDFYDVPDNNKFFAIKYANIIISNPILQTMGVEDEFDHFSGKQKPSELIKATIKENCNNLYLDGHISFPYFLSYDKMNKFVLKAIKNKKVREFLVNVCSEMITKLCEHYPKDFKYKCVNELKECLAFVDNMPKHKYDIIGWRLFVDGEEDADLGETTKGFILRRIIKDKIPKQEIREYLNTLLKKVESVDVSNNDDIIYTLTINNELKYCVSATGSYLIINEKKVKNDLCRNNFGINRICYNEVKSIKKVGANYIIDYGYGWGDGKKILIDRTGEILYEEDYDNNIFKDSKLSW